MMAVLVFSGVAAVAALVVFALAVAWVRRSPPIGLALLCLILVPLWEMPYPPPIVEIAGLSIYPSDVIALVLFVVGVLEATQLHANLRGWLIPWVLFGVSVGISLLIGVAAFGPGAAINEARTMLYFVFAMTWALAVRTDRLRLYTFSLVVGWALVVAAAYHGVVYGFGGASSWIAFGDGVRDGRVLIASQAMALLLCAVTVFLGPSGWSGTRRQFAKVSAAAFLGVAFLAQHRSVWMACAAGTVAVLLWSGQRQARRRTLVLSVLAAWLFLVGLSSGLLESAVESASDMRTYDWRTASWQTLISEASAQGPATIVFGQPFGSGYLRQLPAGVWTTISAHNWYVSIFLRLGVTGLMMLAIVLVSAFLNSRKASSLWTFIIAAVAVYGWPYSVEWYLAPWLGAAIAISLGGSRIDDFLTRRQGQLQGDHSSQVLPMK